MPKKWLAAGGLMLTLAGATLLYFFNVPDKTIGNIRIYGPIAMQLDPDEQENGLRKEEWQPLATKMLDRHKMWSRVGFACIGLGSALQLLAILSPPSVD